jgi:hypothetical protein
MSLREAAIRLTGYPRFRKTQSRGRRELLELLQGQVTHAAFDFPSDARPRIDIPVQFWLDTPSGDFQAQLTSDSRRGKHGQFLIDPAKFVGRYAAWFSNNYLEEGVTAEKRTVAPSELASALVGMHTKKEAYILESEWARFVGGLEQVEHHDESAKSARGRRAFESWEAVLVDVAAELLARQAKGLNLEEQQSMIAAKAVSSAERVLKKGVLLPKVETVAKKIRHILDRMNDLMSQA